MEHDAPYTKGEAHYLIHAGGCVEIMIFQMRMMRYVCDLPELGAAPGEPFPRPVRIV